VPEYKIAIFCLIFLEMVGEGCYFTVVIKTTSLGQTSISPLMQNLVDSLVSCVVLFIIM